MNIENSNNLIELVEILGKTEHFKQDAYFMCGSPSDAPNDDLMNACDTYLKNSASGCVAESNVDALIKELGNELSAIESGKKKAGKEIPNIIRTIIANRDVLL